MINNNFVQDTPNKENINTNNILPETGEIKNNYIKMNSAMYSSIKTNSDNNFKNQIQKNNTLSKHKKMETDLGSNLMSQKMTRMNNSKITEDNKYHLSPNLYKISFDSTDKEKSINNINGLFYIEQYDKTIDIKSLTDQYLKEKLQLKMELKMQSYIQYHKVIRFRHIISKKYLGFQEKKLDKGINNNDNELEKGKTINRCTT